MPLPSPICAAPAPGRAMPAMGTIGLYARGANGIAAAMENAAIVLVSAIAAGALFYPPLARARLWRASVTPLASIIGSGFLVLGPILDASYGAYAPLVMAALCLGAYAFGAAIRFNIAALDKTSGWQSSAQNMIETAASWALAFAYVISVAYYLNLFGAFGVSQTPLNSPQNARILTTAILLLILLVGWTRGFSALERLEQVSVGIKLAIISGMTVGLALYFGQQGAAGKLVVNPATISGWPALTLAFGLIVTVQGFETSRYLGAAYDARTRIRSMQLAQGVAAVIYLIYIGLLSFVFPQGSLSLSETAIIDMMAVVAPILPVLLVAAALSAQFSAAVADTSGAGGLISELTQRRVSSRQGYAALALVGVLLTWTTDLFQIISYASRAFAAYYALQSALAAIAAWTQPGARWKAPFFAALALLGVLITFFGTAVE